MHIKRVSSNMQIFIPKDIQVEMNLNAGDYVAFIKKKDCVIIKKITQFADVEVQNGRRRD